MRLPPPRLVTPRLVLRTITPADAAVCAEYARGEARENARFAPRRPASHFTAARWRRHARVLEEGRRGDRVLALYLFTRDRPERLVGHVWIGNVVRGVFQAANIGYALRKEFEGRGLMSEALRAILPYAFDRMHLHRLMANHLPSNRRSARLLRRFGFRREGIAKAYLLIDGKWRPHVLTSLVNPRWTPPPGDEAARAAVGPRRRKSGARRRPG